jgi:ribulose-phosphate 3-epimerase
MKLAISYLGLTKIEEIRKLFSYSFDYIHLDVMDKVFVNNFNCPMNEKLLLQETNKKLDVHLMVEDVESYIDEYMSLDPEFITFHVETKDVSKMISKIKETKIKVGLSIKPNTEIEKLVPHLNNIDLVLLMSVEPGYGGQIFLSNTIEKIKFLNHYRIENNLKYLIEVDGGINDQNISLLKDVDIVVIGSYITKSKYFQQKIDTIKSMI